MTDAALNPSHAADDHHHADQHGDEHAGDMHVHAVSLNLLFTIFGLLIFLTAVTVGVTAFDFGYATNLLVAMAVAVVKAVLVGLYFMHLRWDTPFHALALIISLVFVGLFIVFCMFDAGDYQGLIESGSYRNVPGQVAPTE